MILETPFYQVDVFSNELFGGNPLAVFLRGKDFKETQLQQVAREMNLSETTFIFPPSNPQADFDIRIFTPEKEIPFAGHPTLGTAYVLSHAGLVPSTKKDLILNFKAGLIPVTLEENDRIFMIQSSAKILQTLNQSSEYMRVLPLDNKLLNRLDRCRCWIMWRLLPVEKNYSHLFRL